MALADLRALARRPVTHNPAPEAVTPVTRNPLPRGYTVEAPKTEENSQFQEAVTPVTRVTRDLSNAGADERDAPIDDQVRPVPEELDEPLWPEPGTPERERLDRKHAEMAAGLLAGYHRHRAALAVRSKPTGR